MNLRKPPALAAWLMERLRVAETNAPLAGDLLEEFERGRSRAWYWRQTFSVLASAARRSVCGTGGIRAGAMAGWAAQAFVFTIWRVHTPSLDAGFTPARFAIISTILIAHGLRIRARRKPGTLVLQTACSVYAIPLALYGSGDAHWIRLSYFVVLEAVWLAVILRWPGSKTRAAKGGPAA